MYLKKKRNQRCTKDSPFKKI